jgi:hypothetical protein
MSKKWGLRKSCPTIALTFVCLNMVV